MTVTFIFLCYANSSAQKFDDPPSLIVMNASAAITLDGKSNEADWSGAPALIIGNGAHFKKTRR